jgi:hypothetical protein
MLLLLRVDTNIYQGNVALERGKRERNQSGERTDVIESIQGVHCLPGFGLLRS